MTGGLRSSGCYPDQPAIGPAAPSRNSIPDPTGRERSTAQAFPDIPGREYYAILKRRAHRWTGGFPHTDVLSNGYRLRIADGDAEMSTTRSRPSKRRTTPRIRRKNLNIDQTKLDRARELLGTETETETVDQALDLILLREDVIRGIRRIAGTGGVVNVFEDDVEPE